MRNTFLYVLLFLSMSYLYSQSNNELEESEKIKKTALDYAEGYYSGSGERMERAIHPDLNKLALLPLRQSDKKYLNPSSFSMLVELSNSKAGFLEEPLEKLRTVIAALKEQQIEGLVAGCTEISLALSNADLSIPLFDPLEIIARKAIRRAGSKRE